MPWEPMLYKLGAWCPESLCSTNWGLDALIGSTCMLMSLLLCCQVLCCCWCIVVVVTLSNNLMSCYWKIMWSTNIVKLLLFMLLNYVDELYTNYYWMWISPLLLECCLYVGNVQIIRFSCCRELTLSRVVLGSLWYVTGWGYCIVFHVLRIIMNYVDEPLRWNFNKLFMLRP